GKPGNITVIAPNNIVLGDVAAVGGGGVATINVTQAQPSGKLTANSLGVVSGSLKPSKALIFTPDITLEGDIIAEGGNVTIKAADDLFMTNTKSIIVGFNSPPSIDVPGRAGGNVNITCNTCSLRTIIADGFPGSDAADLSGAAGGAGGHGGTITITATG